MAKPKAVSPRVSAANPRCFKCEKELGPYPPGWDKDDKWWFQPGYFTIHCNYGSEYDLLDIEVELVVCKHCMLSGRHLLRETPSREEAIKQYLHGHKPLRHGQSVGIRKIGKRLRKFTRFKEAK